MDLERQHMIRVDISGLCAANHVLMERLSVIGRTHRAAMAAVDAAWRNGMQLLCAKCGQNGVATGKAVVWSGSPEQFPGDAAAGRPRG